MRKVGTELQPSREILLTLKQNTAIHLLLHTQCIQSYSKSSAWIEFNKHCSKTILISSILTNGLLNSRRTSDQVLFKWIKNWTNGLRTDYLNNK